MFDYFFYTEVYNTFTNATCYIETLLNGTHTDKLKLADLWRLSRFSWSWNAEVHPLSLSPDKSLRHHEKI